MRRIHSITVVLAMLLFGAAARPHWCLAADVVDEPLTQIPPYKSPVMDAGGIFATTFEQELGSRLEAIWQAGGPQLAVFTLVSLGPESIEQLSIRVATQWRLGSAKDDNGVLLVIAANDRQVRLEIGQGLEGTIPDARARRILDEGVIPNLKRADYERGTRAAFVRVLTAVGLKVDDPWWDASQLAPNVVPQNQARGETSAPGLLEKIHRLTITLAFGALKGLGIYEAFDAVPPWLDFLCLLLMFPVAIALAVLGVNGVALLFSRLPGSSSGSGSSTTSGPTPRSSSSSSSRSSSSSSSSSSGNSKGGGGGFSGGGASGRF